MTDQNTDTTTQQLNQIVGQDRFSYWRKYKSWTEAPKNAVKILYFKDSKTGQMLLPRNIAMDYSKPYWDEPQRVIRMQNLIQSAPESWQAPDWLDTSGVSNLYNYLEHKNQGKEFEDWQRIGEDDPGWDLVKYLGNPPQELLDPKEQDPEYVAYQTLQAWEDNYIKAYDEYAKLMEQGNTEAANMIDQNYQKQMAADWSKLEPWQQFLLTFNSVTPMENRPDWSKGVASAVIGVRSGLGAKFMTSMLIGGAGAALGAAAGTSVGPIGTIVGAAAGLGVGAYSAIQAYKGEENKLSGLLNVFNLPSEFVERLIGTGITYGNLDEAGLTAAEVDLGSVWKAAKSTYESQAVLPYGNWESNAVSKIAHFLNEEWSTGEVADTRAGEVWKFEQGMVAPQLVKNGTMAGDALVEAAMRIQGGEDVNLVYEDMVQNFGYSGTRSDFVVQNWLDPMQYIPYAVNVLGAKIAGDLGNAKLAQAFKDTRGNVMIDALPMGWQQLATAVGGKWGWKSTGGIFDTMASYKYRLMTGDPSGGAFVPWNSYTKQQKLIAGITDTGTWKKIEPFVPEQNKSKMINFLAEHFQLSPEAKAITYLDNLDDAWARMIETTKGDDKVLVEMLQKMTNPDTVIKVGEYGDYYFESPQMRSVIGAYKNFMDNQKTKSYLKNWESSAPQRTQLTDMAALVELSPGKVIEMMENGEYSKLLTMNDKIKQYATENKLTPELLAKRFKRIVDGSIPWYPGDFIARLHKNLMNSTEDYLKTRYDLKPDNTIIRLSALSKSVQSLLLLGLNPNFLVKNMTNNVVTMAYQGVFGFMTPKQVDQFYKVNDIVPPARLKEGFGPAGVTSKLYAKMAPKDVISEAQKVTRFAGHLGIFSKLSATIEAFESGQATTIGIQQFLKSNWKKGSGFRAMDPEIETMIKNLGGDPEDIYRLVAQARSGRDIDTLFSNKPQDKVLKLAEAEEAAKLNGELDDDLLIKSHAMEMLKEQLANGAPPEQAFEKVRAMLQDNVNKQLAENVTNRAAEIQARIKTEGYKVIPEIMEDLEAQRIMNEAQVRLSMNELMNDMAVMKAGGGDSGWADAHLAWELRNPDIQAKRKANFDWYKTSVKGVNDVLDPDNPSNARMIKALDDQENLWINYETFKDDAWDTYYKNKPVDASGKINDDQWQLNKDQVQRSLDELYVEKARESQAYQKIIDESYVDLLGGNDAQKNYVKAWRAEMSQLRERIYNRIAAKFKEMHDSPEPTKIWNEFVTKELLSIYSEMVSANKRGLNKLRSAADTYKEPTGVIIEPEADVITLPDTEEFRTANKPIRDVEPAAATPEVAARAAVEVENTKAAAEVAKVVNAIEVDKIEADARLKVKANEFQTEFAKQAKAAFNLTDIQTNRMMTFLRARAEAWGKRYGKNPGEWFTDRFKRIEQVEKIDNDGGAMYELLPDGIKMIVPKDYDTWRDLRNEDARNWATFDFVNDKPGTEMTKVVNPDGTLKKVYSGIDQSFYPKDEFDPRHSSPANLFGPGAVYTTDAEQVALGYARPQLEARPFIPQSKKSTLIDFVRNIPDDKFDTVVARWDPDTDWAVGDPFKSGAEAKQAILESISEAVDNKKTALQIAYILNDRYNSDRAKFNQTSKDIVNFAHSLEETMPRDVLKKNDLVYDIYLSIHNPFDIDKWMTEEDYNNLTLKIGEFLPDKVKLIEEPFSDLDKIQKARNYLEDPNNEIMYPAEWAPEENVTFPPYPMEMYERLDISKKLEDYAFELSENGGKALSLIELAEAWNNTDNPFDVFYSPETLAVIRKAIGLEPVKKMLLSPEEKAADFRENLKKNDNGERSGSHRDIKLDVKSESDYTPQDGYSIWNGLKNYLEDSRLTNEILSKAGYDGITHVGGVYVGHRVHQVWIPFKSEQVKSVWNKGTFDPKNKNIYLETLDNGEVRARGSVEFDADNKAIIRATRAADFKTFVHEVLHVLTNDLEQDEMKALIEYAGWNKSLEEYRDLQIRKSASTKDSPLITKEEMDIYRQVNEKIVNDAEKWAIYRGEILAPTPLIKAVFRNIGMWLGELYKALKLDPTIHISKKVDAAFKKLWFGEIQDEKVANAFDNKLKVKPIVEQEAPPKIETPEGKLADITKEAQQKTANLEAVGKSYDERAVPNPIKIANASGQEFEVWQYLRMPLDNMDPRIVDFVTETKLPEYNKFLARQKNKPTTKLSNTIEYAAKLPYDSFILKNLEMNRLWNAKKLTLNEIHDAVRDIIQHKYDPTNDLHRQIVYQAIKDGVANDSPVRTKLRGILNISQGDTIKDYLEKLHEDMNYWTEKVDKAMEADDPTLLNNTKGNGSDYDAPDRFKKAIDKLEILAKQSQALDLINNEFNRQAFDQMINEFAYMRKQLAANANRFYRWNKKKSRLVEYDQSVRNEDVEGADRVEEPINSWDSQPEGRVDELYNKSGEIRDLDNSELIQPVPKYARPKKKQGETPAQYAARVQKIKEATYAQMRDQQLEDSYKLIQDQERTRMLTEESSLEAQRRALKKRGKKFDDEDMDDFDMSLHEDLPTGTAPANLNTGVALQEVLDTHLLPLLKRIEDNYNNSEKTYSFDYLNKLDPESRAKVLDWIKKTENELVNTKRNAVNWGTIQRDAALLNYKERTKFDSYLDVVMPYQFWFTRSAMEWGKRMLSKPAIMANYARRINMMQKNGKAMGVYPKRLQGKMKIPTRFAEDWMGTALYMDPWKDLMPVEQLMSGLNMLDQQASNVNPEAILLEMVNNKEITEQEADEALEKQSGSIWSTAVVRAQEKANEDVGNPVNLMAMMMSPSLWITELANIGKKKENLPSTKFGKALQAQGEQYRGKWGDMLGITGKALELPEKLLRGKDNFTYYGKWGDWLIDRMISNMVGEGIIDYSTGLQAMVEREGQWFEEATRRLDRELSMRVSGSMLADVLVSKQYSNLPQAMLQTLFPSGIFPEGEMIQLGLKGEMDKAWDAFAKGDPKPINQFWKDHEGYLARAALNDDPDTRLKKFMVNEIMDYYTQLDDINKGLVKKQMGNNFVTKILEGEGDQIDYAALDPQELSYWIRLIDGYVPKTEATDPYRNPMIGDPELKTFTEAEAKDVKDYMAAKQELHPDAEWMQQTYFKLSSAQEKKEYLVKFPELKSYWEWNKQYMVDHPAVQKWRDEYSPEDSSKAVDPNAGVSMDKIEGYKKTKAEYYPNAAWQQKMYFSLKTDDERRAFLKQYPELAESWDWTRAIEEQDPQIAYWNAKQDATYAYDKAFPEVNTPSPVEIRNSIAVLNLHNFTQQELLIYKVTGDPLSPGALADLQQLWESQGRPYGTIEKFLEKLF